jgi:hypothetical protein
VVFEHPKTFATLAMDLAKKKEVMYDLDAFQNGKDYYARIGKAWKRGHLLYGRLAPASPPLLTQGSHPARIPFFTHQFSALQPSFLVPLVLRIWGSLSH